jgi:hypothetical protein
METSGHVSVHVGVGGHRRARMPAHPQLMAVTEWYPTKRPM